MFEESSREVYEFNPLREVVCQVIFPDILEISTVPPADFQKAIRKTYPLYHRQTHSLELPTDMPPQVRAVIEAQLGIQATPTHQFSSANRRTTVTLTQNSIALSTKEYTDREGYAKALRSVVDSFLQAYDMSIYTRVGLKYVNVIDKNDERFADTEVQVETEQGANARKRIADCEWRELLRTSLIGLLKEDGSQGYTEQSLSQFLIRLGGDVGKLGVRHGLNPLGKANGHCSYLIQLDFFQEREAEYGTLWDIIGRYQALAGNFFRWAVRQPVRRAFGIRSL